MEDSDNNSSLITLIEVSENELENEYVVDSEQDEREIKENEVKLNNLARAKRNWRKCLGCDESENLHRPSKRMRLHFCKSKKVYIQANDRVCDYHLQVQNWDRIGVKTASNFSAKIVDEMISFLLNPQVNALENLENFFDDIGLTYLQFKQVLYELGFPDNPNKIQQRRIMSVRLYLERLRHGHTYEQMARRHNTNRRRIGIKVKLGRSILLQSFVPRHLGYNNLNRECLLEHTTDLARLLYCNNDPTKSVTIWDGTYIYTCNTSNHAHQRKIYSGQKRRHLFKIMKVVAADGSILDVFGPFEATKNDAEILKIVFEKTSVENIFRPGDIFLVDRGFRDAVKFLEKKKFNVKIPQFIEKGNNAQLTTKQDNTSRLVTKMRYAIEVANGRMKSKWNLFGKTVPSILTKYLMSDYKIGAAMLNAFAKQIICDKHDFESIGLRMLNNVNTKNELRQTINSKPFKQTARLYFEFIEPTQLDFPRFNREEIKKFALGTYVIRQAVSYTADHMKLHGHFKISRLPTKHIWAHFGRICINDNFKQPMFISTPIKSRFRSQKMHTVHILYDFTAVPQGRLHYLCECQHGQRTVGCCAHVMTVVWYFGYGRYEKAKDPASHLNNFF